MSNDKRTENFRGLLSDLKTVIMGTVDRPQPIQEEVDETTQPPTLKLGSFYGKPQIKNEDVVWLRHQTNPELLAHLKEQKKEYVLRIWGCPEDGPGQFNGDRWFNSLDELRDCKEKISRLPSGASSASYGSAVRAKTLTEVTMRVPTGEEYVVHDDFGYGYPPDAARYMYVSGNYGCDCNRSIKLNRMGVAIEHLDCGETISTVKVKVFLDWGNGKKFEIEGLEKGDLFPGEVG